MKGSSYLGLDLSIDSSMGTLFEFPSVLVDVGSYQSLSEKILFKMHWLSPNDYPEVSIFVCQIVRCSEVNVTCT